MEHPQGCPGKAVAHAALCSLLHSEVTVEQGSAGVKVSVKILVASSPQFGCPIGVTPVLLSCTA